MLIKYSNNCYFDHGLYVAVYSYANNVLISGTQCKTLQLLIIPGWEK